MARTNNQRIRQLLLTNLYEECGLKEEDSHVSLLEKTIKSVGIKTIPETYTPFIFTRQLEEWFYNTYDSYDTYKSLCVLGPATEAISAQFLLPFKNAVLKVFNERDVSVEYFEIHLSETEAKHADNCEEALSLLEKEDKSLCLLRDQYTNEGIEIHNKFWKYLKINVLVSE
jgi:pyrroloquinoline quinone (PQQ) biosynthesis protein C